VFDRIHCSAGLSVNSASSGFHCLNFKSNGFWPIFTEFYRIRPIFPKTGGIGGSRFFSLRQFLKHGGAPKHCSSTVYYYFMLCYREILVFNLASPIVCIVCYIARCSINCYVTSPGHNWPINSHRPNRRPMSWATSSREASLCDGWA
jgi:hypothetical protein